MTRIAPAGVAVVAALLMISTPSLPAPGGETAEEVAARADRVLARAVAAAGVAALFSHGHFLRVLGARWIGQPVAAGTWLGLDTATVSCLGHVAAPT